MGAVAFISDIHGNWEALESTLARLDALGIKEIYCLGDIVGYGPDPERCVEEIALRCSRVVAGNHDWAVAGKTSMEDFNTVAREALLWTRKRLSPGHLDYLASLPLSIGLESLFLVHASPLRPHQWLYIMDQASAALALEEREERIVVVGHTHIPLAYRLKGGNLEALTFPFPVEEGARYLVNAGSVGQPRDGDPRACCLILERDSMHMERIPYPVDITARKIQDRGLPASLALRIQEGW